MACNTLQNELQELLGERSACQEELRSAPTNQKAGLAGRIKALNRQIALKKQEIDLCLAQNPTPTMTPLNTTFSGTYSITINHPAVSMPLTGSVSANVLFNAPRTTVLLTSFSPLSATFGTPFGDNTTTVSLLGSASGIFDKPSGSMTLMLPLFFDHSIDLPFYDEDSTLTIPLGTGSAGTLVGSPLDAAGALALVGSAVLMGGFLNGTRADLAIMGTLAVLP